MKEEHQSLKVLRALDQAECDRIADEIDADVKQSLGDAGVSVNRKILYEFGKYMPKFRIPTMAMMALAESDKMSKEAHEMLGVPLDRLQNEATSRAMMIAVDFACAPKPDEISEGSPDLSDLT